MTDLDPTMTRTRSSEAQPLPPRTEARVLADDFRTSFGEELTATLDVERWRTGVDLGQEYQRIEREVHEAITQETEVQRRVRTEVHPRLQWATHAPKGAGCHVVRLDEIRQIHHHLLFPGGVEACAGLCQIHDTLALTMCQLSVGLVSYRGNSGAWSQRLYRRDLRFIDADPIDETLRLLEQRARRPADTARDRLSQLAKRGILAYAERAVLLRKGTAPWRLGLGNLAPLELVVPTEADLAIESIRVLRELIEGHQKFVFVTGDYENRLYQTIGHSLHPLEYAIIGTLREQIEPHVQDRSWRSQPSVDASWDGQTLSTEAWVLRFLDEVATKVVVGVYRATQVAPAQLFYAHEDHADIAARIALADSMLHETPGGPMLVDLAQSTCRSAYGGGNLNELARVAYASAATTDWLTLVSPTGSR